MNADLSSSHNGNLSDLKVIDRVLLGDIDAFESLLKKYKKYIMKITNKHVPHDQVDEIVQEIFIRAYQSLPTFKQNGGFKQWLSGVAVRTCYDYWRKRYRSKELPMSTLTEKHEAWLETVMTEKANHAFEEMGKQEEAKELLDSALNMLSPEDRMVIELVYFEGLSGKEAAKLLGWSTANIKIRSFRSRKKLKKIILDFQKK